MTENHLPPISIFLYENQPSRGFPPLAREETALQALADYGQLVPQPSQSGCGQSLWQKDAERQGATAAAWDKEHSQSLYRVWVGHLRLPGPF